MKNISICFCMLFPFLNIGSAQSMDKTTTYIFHAETELASYNLAFSAKLGKRVWFGLGVGGGLSLVHGNFKAPFKNDWTKENYHTRFFLANNPQKKFNFEIGTLFGQVNQEEEVGDFVQGQRFSSGYIRLFYGWERFKIGSQFSIGEFDKTKETIWMWTPIVLRFTVFATSSKE